MLGLRSLMTAVRLCHWVPALRASWEWFDSTLGKLGSIPRRWAKSMGTGRLATRLILSQDVCGSIPQSLAKFLWSRECDEDSCTRNHRLH